MTMKKIIAIVFFLPLLAFAQKSDQWYQEFEKLESNFRYGRYYQASASASHLLKRMEKKGEFQEFLLPTQALYYKYESAMGIRLNNDSLLVELMGQWDSLTIPNSDSFMLVGNYCMATAAFSFQNFEQARLHFEAAVTYVNTDSDPQNYWAQRIRVAKMKLFIETMSYNAAQIFISPTIEHQKNLTKRVQVVFNPKTNKEEKTKLKKKEYKHRLTTLGLLMVMKGDIALGQGNLNAADSIYVRNRHELLKMVKKKDISYLNNSYGKTRLRVLQGDPLAAMDLKNIRKKYATQVKYSIPNLTYLDIFENEIRADAQLDNYSKYKSATKQFQREVSSNFPNKSAHIFTAEYLGQLENLTKGKYKTYGKRMNKQALNLKDYYGPKDAGQISFLYDLATAQINLYDFEGAKKTYLNILELADYNNSDSSSFFYNANLELGSYYLNYTTEFAVADSLFSGYYEPFVLKELHPYHPYYGKFLNDYALIDTKLDRFNEAIIKYQQLADINSVKYGDLTEEYALVLQRMASAQIDIGDYTSAEQNLIQALLAFKTEKKTKTQNYIYTQQAIGELYAINGDFINAKRNLQDAYQNAGKFDLVNEMLPINANEALAELYFEVGKYDNAEDILIESILIKGDKLGENSPELINAYALLGQIYLVQGKLIEAEKLIGKSVDISKQTYGKHALRYLERKILLGDIYYKMGDSDRSVEIYNSVISEYESKFGDNYLNLADLLIRKSRVQLNTSATIASLMNDLNRANTIITTNVNDHHPMIAEVTELKAMVYIREKNFDQALIQLQAANLIYSSTYGDNHFKTADNQVNIATLYYKKGSYVNALSFYNRALGIYKKIFSDSHPKYVSTLSKIGRTYYAQKNYKRAAETLRQSTQMYLSYISDYFPSLSEMEKDNYWSSIQGDFELFNSLALNYYKNDDAIIGEMYNNRLATKAILLNSSLKLKKRILNYGSPELISKYTGWLSKKDSLLVAQGMNKNTLDSLNINIAEMRSEINTIEKELSESAEGFSRNYENKAVDWSMVQNKLAPNESAMEIIRFNYFDTEFTDSVIYVGLFVDKETKNNPEIIILPNGNDLENKYFSYYQNAVKQKTKDTKSYANYWEYFDSKLRGKNKIYFSGDGVYNQLNPETFKNFDGAYLMDSYTFYFISNTRDIVDQAQSDKPLYTNTTAVMFGNPKFETTITGHSKNSITPLDALPGAELEVNLLDSFLVQSNWTTENYVGIEATETKLKEVVSPRILHIATHGFFMADEHHKNQTELVGTEQQTTTNPLLRSGLLFTGAAPLLATENVYQFNQTDGVLTAFEAMNLNLDQTEIVFLSACETGRGEVKSGEGVYGLQRSFIVAGAQNVVMTLFKVDDAVTQKLVTLFYTEWIKTGDKRTAFNNAKKTILEEYKDPIYWGSFIMVGLD
jgi:CHAT domain-containing protein